MSATMGDVGGGAPIKVASHRDPKFIEAFAIAGGAGPWAGFTVKGESNVNLLRTDVGLHTITYPATAGRVFFDFFIVAPTSGVFYFKLLTHSPSTGVSTFRSSVSAGGAGNIAADFAAGESIDIQIWGDSRGTD